jgi:phage terminase small subunit
MNTIPRVIHTKRQQSKRSCKPIQRGAAPYEAAPQTIGKKLKTHWFKKSSVLLCQLKPLNNPILSGFCTKITVYVNLLSCEFGADILRLRQGGGPLLPRDRKI